jgi:FG-GAP-like repeat/Bacterial Ig domain
MLNDKAAAHRGKISPEDWQLVNRASSLNNSESRSSHMLKISIVSKAILVLAAYSANCIGQTSSATFQTQYSDQRPSTDVAAVDVNNDGILDLVQQVVPSGLYPSTFKPAFTVRIANGDGSFRAPVVYTFAPSVVAINYYGTPMVSGDFNGDGNVDLLFEGTTQLLLYPGNGDGTFQAPKYITVDFPSGQQVEHLWLTADLTGDGKLDLVVTALNPSAPRGTPEAIYLIPGKGAGDFAAATSIDTLPATDGTDTNRYSAATLLAGDFDGDGKADIAFVEDYICEKGQICTSAVHVLYNEVNSRFSDTTTNATIEYAGFTISSTGDLNSDGRTDIFVSSYSSDTSSIEFYLLYGQAGRAFHMYTIPNFTPSAMADFNGDTMMDLVGTSPNSSGFLFLLGLGSEGSFTQESYTPVLPYFSPKVVGDFNFDTKPDVLDTEAKTTSTYVLSDSLNTTASGNWGGCAYPKSGMGIMICAPGPSPASPVTFNASANSFGQLRKIELWVDGKKITEQFHAWGPRAWFNFSGAFAAGPHNAVMYAVDIDNRLQKAAFSFTVAGGAACSAPTSPGVHICLPVSGSAVSSPVQVEATATVNGTIANTQLWVDGVKKFTAPSNSINTSLSLAAGSHRFAVLAVNTAGQKWESAVNTTVK